MPFHLKSPLLDHNTDLLDLSLLRWSWERSVRGRDCRKGRKVIFEIDMIFDPFEVEIFFSIRSRDCVDRNLFFLRWV
jgi:hypothetical protein